MSLATLLTDVYGITGRPDLVTQTTQAVKAATLKAHMSDFYYRDLVEVNQATGSTATFFQLATTLFPRFRALKYIQKSQAVRDETFPYPFLGIIDTDQIMDEYNEYVLNAAYVAGLNINIRVDAALTHVKVGYFALPNITDGGFSSWIDDTQPYAIVCEAARTMFKTLGYDEESRTYDMLVMEQLTLLKMSNIGARGY